MITGLGLVTPLGVGTEETWAALCAGQSGVGAVTRFDASDFPCRIAAEVRGFDPEEHIDPREIRRTDRFVQFALAAAKMALRDSALPLEELDRTRCGCILGVGLGGLETMERGYEVYQRRGPRRLSPLMLPAMIANMAPGQVAIRYGLGGPNYTVTSACASGAHALGDACQLIRNGVVDQMVTGGAEATITPIGLGSFTAMKALSTRNDDPQGASRPFDADRDGFVCGEGAGILVLEEAGQAVARGATIYAEVAGFGLTCDAHHVTAPDPEGEGARRAMTLALKEAGASPVDIQYINAHGTSTPYNDRIETLAIHRTFGEYAPSLAVSSTKSMTGHLLGAAGAVEAAFCALALRDQLVPPTLNYQTPDPDCDLDYVPGAARPLALEQTLSNAFGFGGTNASLLLRLFQP